MSEETPGFDEKPEVPADGTPEDDAAEPKAAASSKEEAAAPAGDSAAASDVALLAQLDQARTALGERTADLQRLQAEYQNYRRRVERDRIAVKEIAVASLLTELLPTLDDIGRAREHGELVGGFKSVAESLETAAAKMGLQQFGKEGEPFDPTIHEALMHSYAPDVTEDTCVAILQPGYRIGERTIRPARVAVAEPQPGAAPKSEAAEGESASDKDADAPDKG
ncbi:nucleotide exchange factor GrpE [Streptomyces sp. NBC_01264]|uniref:nucleotide exchange factor GrpE n=1 Tax=Streptomyces sp. NBC_01264 TaxID=2903804 RepID=UPI00225B13D6|nr:nucleotide exchange factor GrpE [Streptomyces sp. NBC_01264]MCX4779910.1 nucleotide exchange factor GrpE [Streptomyces sp. NBC_01264]